MTLTDRTILNRRSAKPASRRMSGLLSRQPNPLTRRQVSNPQHCADGVLSARRRHPLGRPKRRERLDGTGVKIKSP